MKGIWPLISADKREMKDPLPVAIMSFHFCVDHGADANQKLSLEHFLFVLIRVNSWPAVYSGSCFISRASAKISGNFLQCELAYVAT
jgi:hypothetical protein